jgi:hypothetical protein
LHAAQWHRDAVSRREQIAAYRLGRKDRDNALKRSPAIRMVRNQNRRQRRVSDPAWDIADRLRKRIGRAIRDHGVGIKHYKIRELLGCSVEQLIAHLECNFLSGMSWQNRRQWHVDHVRPCASFDLRDAEQQRACFHFSNLRPLWALDNMRKHARLEGP